MITRRDRIKLGAFLLGGTLLLVVILVLFGGLRLWDSREQYTVYYTESVNGLSPGSQVRLQGVRVGTVKALRVNPEDVEQVEVTLALEPDTPVKADTTAVLSGQGLTGLKYIDLRGGTRASARLKPGATITPGSSGMEAMMSRAEEVSVHAERVMSDVSAMMSERNRERVEQILDETVLLLTSAREATQELTLTLRTTRGFVQRHEAQLSTIIANTSRASARFDGTLAEATLTMRAGRQAIAGAELAPLVAQLTEVARVAGVKLDQVDAEQLVAAIGALRELITRLIDGIGRHQDHLGATMLNMRRASDDLRGLSRSLRERPSRLIFDNPPEPRELP